jgi:hypothetical protein
MAEANKDRPTDTAIVFRIGLHLGDLIVEGDDLYSDGVNVAARLEAEAAPATSRYLAPCTHHRLTPLPRWARCDRLPGVALIFEPVALVLSLSVTEALLHLFRKYDTEGSQGVTRSIAMIKPQDCFPDFSFISIRGPERMVGHWLCQDRRNVRLQTVSLL